MDLIKEKIKNLPQAPGVYFFYDEQKNLLYIGKATNLRSRVRSYFRGVIPNSFRDLEEPGEMLKQVQHDIGRIVEERGPWIAKMVGQVSDISFQETDSVLEALILESNLIKKHQPKYNTLEKDDKSFAYFVITRAPKQSLVRGTAKEEFPRVIILRKTDLEKNKDIIAYKFGPYTSKNQMQIALKIMRRIFPFHSMKQKTEKGCLDFQLGVCPGPYANAISKEDYKKNIRGIKMILEGKKKTLISKMEKEMQVCSKKHDFECAADLRNKIFALKHIRDVALMGRDFDSQTSNVERNTSNVTRVEAYDISNISGDHAVGSMIVFANDKPDKSQYRKFKIKTVVGSDDVGMMKEVLQRRFKNDWTFPDLIILDGGVGHVNMGQKVLQEFGLQIPLVGVAKGPSRKKLEIVIGKMPTNSKLKTILENQNLLKYITDEAHRFAITFHRHRRKKGMLD